MMRSGASAKFAADIGGAFSLLRSRLIVATSLGIAHLLAFRAFADIIADEATAAAEHPDRSRRTISPAAASGK
jgi:hypothetical protein